MIKNDKQLSQNKKRLGALINLENKFDKSSLPFEQMQTNRLKNEIKEVEYNIDEYNSFKSTNINGLHFNLENLHKSIVALRLASKLTQKELAVKVGLQEQQIQRYEEQEYEKASFERIIQIISTMVDDINLSFIKEECKRIQFSYLSKNKGLNARIKDIKKNETMLEIA